MKTKHHSILSAPVIQSGDQTLNNPIRRRWSALALSGFLFTSVLTLLPFSAQAGCSQYDVSGQWTIVQGSYRISVALSQNGKTVSGTASQVHGKTTGKGDVDIVQGQVNGTVEGDNFHVQINWSGGGAGVYSGTIGRESVGMTGTTYDKNKGSSSARWFTDHHFDCADAAPVGPKPIKASGKARPDTTPIPTPKPIRQSGKAFQLHTPAPTPSAEADESSSNDTEDQHGKHKKNKKNKKKHHHHHDDDDNQEQGND